MELENILYDYKTALVPKINEEVEKYFEYLTTESKIDLKESAILETKFKKETEEYKRTIKKQKSSKNWKKTSIIQFVFSLLLLSFFIFSVYHLYSLSENNEELNALFSSTDPYFFILIIIVGISLFLIPHVWLIYAFARNKFKDKKSSLISIANISINSTIVFATTATMFSIIEIDNQHSNNDFYLSKIISIVFMAFWGVLLIVDIALLIYFSKVSKNVAKQLEEVNSRLFSTNQLLINNLKPLKNLTIMDGISKEIVDKIFSFLKLNVKTSQNIMDIADFEKIINKTPALSKTRSIRYLQSGELNGFPFIYVSSKNLRYVNVTYKGTKDVTYTKTRTVRKDGRSYVESYQHTERLVAYHTAPMPNYYNFDMLYYFNPATPELGFSRKPNHVDKLKPRELNKFIKKQNKLFESKYKDSINKNSNFQPILGNLKFESLFNCLDRNNETEYRLLFTPLAQKQYEQLLLTQDFSDGDDFDFSKSGAYHRIKREELSKIKSKLLLIEYIDSFDNWGLCFNDLKAAFVSYYQKGIQSLFKSLAPIMAIPLYMELPNHNKINNDFMNDIAIEQLEADINSSKPELLRELLNHEKSTGEQIYKVTEKVQNGTDVEYSVTAYGHQEVPRVEYVSVRAGNGQKYQVPVDWIEYKKVQKTSKIPDSISEVTEIHEYINKQRNSNTDTSKEGE
ncbi:MAG1210 family protein [Mycoplasma sp. B6188]|uniref:MAG1210 family protein n=1 Tax=Mycoplasma sp. B6188 TaxID=3401673 RepID=UPI003AAE1ACE